MILNRRFSKHATIPDAHTHILEQPSVFETLTIVILIDGHVYWCGGSQERSVLRETLGVLNCFWNGLKGRPPHRAENWSILSFVYITNLQGKLLSPRIEFWIRLSVFDLKSCLFEMLSG